MNKHLKELDKLFREYEIAVANEVSGKINGQMEGGKLRKRKVFKARKSIEDVVKKILEE